MKNLIVIILLCVVIILEAILVYDQRGYIFISEDTIMAKFNEKGWAGYYNPGKEYYCVKLKGLDMEIINDTDYHEACHHFINKLPEHFCDPIYS